MPTVFIPALVFVMALILLGKGSDYFVESAVRLAKYFGISEFIIGLTLIAVGTSIPELAASLMAAYSGNSEVILGNVIGSNIANICLILGISAAITTLLVEPYIFKRDVYILMGISLIFYLFTLDGVISIVDGLMLLFFFFFYVSFLFNFKPRFIRLFRFKEYFDYHFDFDQMLDMQTYTQILMMGIDPRTYMRLVGMGINIGVSPFRIARDGIDRKNYERVLEIYKRKMNLEVIKEFSMLFLSGVAIFLGARYFIDSAVEIALILDIPKTIIGLTIVSIGTSLPELTIAVTSARKGFGNMVLGNIIGSNIANISLIVGISALITPIVVAERSVPYVIYLTVPFMIIITLISMIFFRSGWAVRRWEGVSLFMTYILFLTVTFYHVVL